MSYYYNYYIGYEHEGKIYPLGPYDINGKLHDVLSRSHNFASDLHYRFYSVPENKISNELRKEFEYENWKHEKIVEVKMCEMDDLPVGSFIKTGYFLIEDVEEYERDHHEDDLFYDCITPTVYNAMVSNELMFGKPANSSEEDSIVHTASDYMYYAYPSYRSEEYEASVLRYLASVYEYDAIPKGAKIVFLMTEG